MPEKSSHIPLTSGRNQVNDELIDPKKIISLIKSRWYFFLGALLTSLIIAFVYNTCTMPLYRVSASILIEEDKKGSPSGNDQLMDGYVLMPGMKNLDNQIMVLTSRNLVLKTLDKLNFNLEFYYKGLIEKKSLFPLKPINIISVSDSTLPEDVEFGFKYLGNNMFRIDAKSEDTFELHKKASFGDEIAFPNGFFRIEKNESEWSAQNEKKKFYFIFHSSRKLVENYVDRLKIGPVTKKGTIVKVILEGTNKIEDLTFLNNLTSVFVNISLEKKNTEAIRTIQFIDDQLSGISDSLVRTESRLQKFRTKNRVMNLSSQGQVIIDQVMKLENEKARLGMEAKYYDYLTGYLEKDVVGEVPIAPATIGIVDPGLSKLVSDLADLQGQYYSKGMGDKNPMQSQYALRIKNIKEALKETLKGMKGANDLALKDNLAQIDDINAQASALPKTERELLGIERKYKLNDELYTFLLEKRAVAQMQKASNTADNEIIDYPEYENDPVSPKKPLIYFFALFIGISFPFLWSFITEFFNVRIKEPEDINKITDIPVSGHIPHNRIKANHMLMENSDSPLSESYRIMRSRMQFFIKEIQTPVILITSSMPDEGKTTVAINLASAYSLLGKKTILVGFDLRQPGIFKEFDIDNNHGVSTWLIGKDHLKNIIFESKYENLHIIPSGPIPPNPAELTILDKTEELIRLLKERYDYIIIDTPPVGLVSDTYHLITLADVCIMVVRPNLTLKDLFAETIKELENSNIKSLSLVINDIMPNGRTYGYGGKYRYGLSNKTQKKNSKINLLSLFNNKDKRKN
jgi:tyrosine-protein kinase Etk/Wzc